MFGYFGIYLKSFPSETVLITSYFRLNPVYVQFLIFLKEWWKKVWSIVFNHCN